MMQKNMSDLDAPMSSVLRENIDEDMKAKKYLLLLQQYLKMSSASEEERTRPIHVTYLPHVEEEEEEEEEELHRGKKKIVVKRSPVTTRAKSRVTPKLNWVQF